MKNLIIALFALTSLSASATPLMTTMYNLRCEGSSARLDQNVEVSFGGDLSDVAVTIHDFDRAPTRFDTRSYAVTTFHNGFPTTVVKASEDKRPVDGALVEISLNVHTESYSIEDGHPGTLVIKSTHIDRRTGDQVSTERTYPVACQIAQ